MQVEVDSSLMRGKSILTFLSFYASNIKYYLQCGPSMTFWKIDILFGRYISFLPKGHLSAKKDIYLPKWISIYQKGYLSSKTSLTVRTVCLNHFNKMNRNPGRITTKCCFLVHKMFHTPK